MYDLIFRSYRLDWMRLKHLNFVIAYFMSSVSGQPRLIGALNLHLRPRNASCVQPLLIVDRHTILQSHRHLQCIFNQVKEKSIKNPQEIFQSFTTLLINLSLYMQPWEGKFRPCVTPSPLLPRHHIRTETGRKLAERKSGVILQFARLQSEWVLPDVRHSADISKFCST